MPTYRYGFIGGGNMATAILTGLLKEEICRSPAEILVSDISTDRLAFLSETFLIGTTTDNRKVASGCGAIVLAIKPQTLSDVAAGLAGSLPGETVLVSILAGVKSERLKAAFGGHERVVRTMPNLPATIGKGVAAVALVEGTPEESYREAETILGSVGATTRVPESLIDAVTAVSGSGPGYVFRIAEAMIAGGVEAGLSEEQAKVLVSQTLLGASEMLAWSEGSAAEALPTSVLSRGHYLGGAWKRWRRKVSRSPSSPASWPPAIGRSSCRRGERFREGLKPSRPTPCHSQALPPRHSRPRSGTQGGGSQDLTVRARVARG